MQCVKNEGGNGEESNVLSKDNRIDDSLPHIDSFIQHITTSRLGDDRTSSRDLVSLIGKRRPIKIHIGWMHKVGDKYRQVRRKYGGGTRELVLENLNIFPAEIVRRAITLFFPDGISQVANVGDLESFALGNFCGEEMERFTDKQGKECSLGKYLKAQGTYASRCYIYLLTKQKVNGTATKHISRSRRAVRIKNNDRYANVSRSVDSNNRPQRVEKLTELPPFECRLYPTDKLGYVIEERQPIQIRYCFQEDSPFTNVIHGEDFSRKECLDFSLFRYPLLDIVDFEPTNYGFVVKSITIGGNKFVEDVHKEFQRKCFIFPQAVEDSALIIHPPSTIWGYHGDELIIGTVASCHGIGSAWYTWYQNEAIFREGPNLACITVTSPGLYFCHVTFGNCYDVSRPLQVVDLFDPKRQHASDGTNLSLCCSYGLNVPAQIIPTINRSDLSVDFTSKICNGTFGTVYRALWLGSDVHVTFVDICQNDGHVLNSIIETNTRIRHPNIVSLMACAETSQQLLLITEYHEGASLESLIFSAETRQYLTLEFSLKQTIANQTCQALAYLHTLHPPIAHLGINPSNIWVLHQGTTAKLCCPEFRDVQVTTSNLLFYQAPECLVSFQDGGLPADVWGLGASLTVMLTEESLWSELSQKDGSVFAPLVEKLEQGHFPSALASIPVWKDILTACFNIDPSLRPSALQLLSHIRN